MFRIGSVTDVDKTERTVRVLFNDEGIVSGRLKVLKSPPLIPADADEQKTETESSHYHKLDISPWLPEIGDYVLCAYNGDFNGDGFVLGAL